MSWPCRPTRRGARLPRREWAITVGSSWQVARTSSVNQSARAAFWSRPTGWDPPRPGASGTTRLWLSARWAMTGAQYAPPDSIPPCSSTSGGPSPPWSRTVDTPASSSRRSVTGSPARSRSREWSMALGAVVVYAPHFRRWRRRGAHDLRRRENAVLEEALRVVLGLPDLDHAPAAGRARPREVEDATGRPLQSDQRPQPLVDLLRAVGVVHDHRDRHFDLLAAGGYLSGRPYERGTSRASAKPPKRGSPAVGNSTESGPRRIRARARTPWRRRATRRPASRRCCSRGGPRSSRSAPARRQSPCWSRLRRGDAAPAARGR